MKYDFNDPKYWLDCAEQMRTSATSMKDSGNREIMLRIADDYERLGYRAYQLSRTRS